MFLPCFLSCMSPTKNAPAAKRRGVKPSKMNRHAHQTVDYQIQSRHQPHEPPAPRRPRPTASTTTAAEDAAQNRYKPKSFEPKVFKIDNNLPRGVDYHHSKRHPRTPSPTPLSTPPKLKVRQPPRYPFSKRSRLLISPIWHSEAEEGRIIGSARGNKRHSMNMDTISRRRRKDIHYLQLEPAITN